MNDTQSQILFEEEFMEIIKKERLTTQSAIAISYRMFAEGTGLRPSTFSAIPEEWQKAFECAMAASYEAGFRDGYKMTNEMQP